MLIIWDDTTHGSVATKCLQVLQVYRMDGVNSVLLMLQLTTLCTQFYSFNAAMLYTGELLTFLNQCSEDKRGIIFHNPWTTNEVRGKKSLSMTKLTVEKLCLCCRCSPHTHTKHRDRMKIGLIKIENESLSSLDCNRRRRQTLSANNFFLLRALFY